MTRELYCLTWLESPAGPKPPTRTTAISIPRLFTILKVSLCRSGESLSSAASRSRTYNKHCI